MKLFFYILKSFLISFLRVSAFFMALVFLMDLVNQLTEYASNNVGFWRIFVFCLLRFPDNFLLFLPLLVLLSALFCFLGLSNSSEIVILRAAGIPATRFVFVPMMAIFVFGFTLITIFSPLIISARTSAQDYENQLMGRQGGMISSADANGIWIRSNQGEDSQEIFRMGRVDWSKASASEVTVYRKHKGAPLVEINSPSAKFVSGEWRLRNASKITYADKVSVERVENLTLTADAEFESVFADYFSPKNLTIKQLPDYIHSLEKDGYNSNEAKGYYYQQLAMPIGLMTLCLIGSIFALAPPRIGGMALRIVASITTGFIVYAASRLAESLGVVGTIPIAISALAIPVPAFFISVAILLNQEDG